jgi:glutathionyl-hydroquinone reductase
MNVINQNQSQSQSKDIPDNLSDNNYLNLTDNNFIFKNFKTKKTYKEQVVPISDNLLDIVKVYLKFHPLKKEIKKKLQVPLLVDFEGNPYNNSNDITRILNKIFDKKIGSSLLRNIYLTDKYSDQQKELALDVKNMGTSKGTAESNYIKTD